MTLFMQKAFIWLNGLLIKTVIDVKQFGYSQNSTHWGHYNSAVCIYCGNERLCHIFAWKGWEFPRLSKHHLPNAGFWENISQGISNLPTNRPETPNRAIVKVFVTNETHCKTCMFLISGEILIFLRLYQVIEFQNYNTEDIEA